MSDLIDRQAAIDVLNKHSVMFGFHLPHEFHEVKEEIRGLPSAQPTQENYSNTLDALDCVSRQAAIDVEGIDEQIRCEMCRNPMHTDRGCDGNCKYDEKLYERIMQILDERIKPLSSAQPRIIRCKNCKHWTDKNAGLCDIWDYYISNEEFFCGCGERREADD